MRAKENGAEPAIPGNQVLVMNRRVNKKPSGQDIGRELAGSLETICGRPGSPLIPRLGQKELSVVVGGLLL